MGLLKNLFDYETKELKKINKIVDEIDANFKNGILSLTCPKKEQVETKKTISIKESE